MYLLLSRQKLDEFKRRFDALKPDSPRRWGKMAPADMLLHLSGVVELSLGQRAGPKIGNVFTYTIGKYLIFYVLPWPRGTIKVPADWTPESQSTLDAERERLFRLMDEFVEISSREPRKIATHPMFGDCKLAFWQRIHGKHFDHHLRQFGV